MKLLVLGMILCPAIRSPAATPVMRIKAGTHYKIPTGECSQWWLPYPALGGHIELPVTATPLWLRFEADAGRISTIDGSTRNLTTVGLGASVVYEIPVSISLLRLRIPIGLSSTAVRISEETFIRHLNLQATSENEFGCIGGIEPVVRTGRFELSLPVRFNHTFSSPTPFTYISAALTAGINLY